MKANKLQQEICDVIKDQASFWKSTDDITSLTHLGDIHMSAHLTDLPEEDADAFEELLQILYWFIREFDTNKL